MKIKICRINYFRLYTSVQHKERKCNSMLRIIIYFVCKCKALNFFHFICLMEPEIREFFRRLSTSIGLFIIWMVINMVIGIKLGCAFFNDKIYWYNILFYTWAVLSFAGLIFFLIKMWKKPIEHLNDWINVFKKYCLINNVKPKTTNYYLRDK